MALLGSPLRSLVAAEVGFLKGEESPDPAQYLEPAGAPGLLGADSVAWTIHADPAMFVGGIRALILQTLHPLAMAGIAEHSNYRSDPLGRLRRTGGFITATTYGSRAQAEEAIAIVRRVHDKVEGQAPDGRRYRANDPDLLTWVHVSEVHSFLSAYRAFGRRPLTPAEIDRYYAETAPVAIALGADSVPASADEVRDYFAELRPQLYAGRQSGETVRWILSPRATGIPLTMTAPYALLTSAAIGLLPRWAQRELRLPALPVLQPVLVRPAAKRLLNTLQWAMGTPAAVEAAHHRLDTA